MTTDTHPPRLDDSAVGLADELMDLVFEAEPLGATLLGVPGHDDRLGDPSVAATQALRERLVALAGRADALIGSTVDGPDRVTLAVVAQQVRALLDRIQANEIEYTISDLFVSPAAGLITALPMIVL